MIRTTIAEILHAKDPMRFGKLVGHLIERGLLDPAAVRGRRSSMRRAIQGRQRRRGRGVFSCGALRSALRPTPLAG